MHEQTKEQEAKGGDDCAADDDGIKHLSCLGRLGKRPIMKQGKQKLDYGSLVNGTPFAYHRRLCTPWAARAMKSRLG